MKQNEQIEHTLATVHELLRAAGLMEAATIVRECPANVELVDHDNWNGGTNIWEFRFELPAQDFVRLDSKRSQLEEQITARLEIVTVSQPQNRYFAKIIPSLAQRSDWRTEEPELPRQTRINIIDGLRIDSIDWSGQLDEVEFLSRLFDLKALPSTDHRYQDAASDIWQHRVNNDDWDVDWIYADERFQLIDGSTEVFLRFLCEVVHPVVRPNHQEAIKLVSHFNDQLLRMGWEIYEEERISGRPRFSYRPVSSSAAGAVKRGRSVADALNAGWMAKEIERVEKSIDNDPALAIGTAKELVETCCKSILTKRGVEINKNDDLITLTKKLTKELQLVPEGISDAAKGAENIRLILRNLTQLTNNLAQLRGLYGTGHGRDGQHRGLQPRHARLAVASAVAFIDFVSDTFHQREQGKI